MFEYIDENLKFSEIINLEQFNKLNEIEKYQFMIKNEFFIKKTTDSNIKEIFDLNFAKNTSDTSAFDFNIHSGFNFKGDSYIFNNKIFEEFYDVLKTIIDDGGLWEKNDPSYYKVWLTKNISHFLKKKQKLKFLHKEYLKYRNLFVEGGISDVYLDQGLISIYYTTWKEYVFICSSEEMFKYLTEPYYNIRFDSKLIDTWVNLSENHTIMMYCKEEIELIEKQSETLKTQKRLPKLKGEELIYINNSKPEYLSVNQQIILLDKIRGIDEKDWENYHNTKKAKLLSLLFGKSCQNIRANLPLLSKPTSTLPKKFHQDIEYIENILKRILND